jgi:hypothetical protein
LNRSESEPSTMIGLPVSYCILPSEGQILQAVSAERISDPQFRPVTVLWLYYRDLCEKPGV